MIDMTWPGMMDTVYGGMTQSKKLAFVLLVLPYLAVRFFRDCDPIFFTLFTPKTRFSFVYSLHNPLFFYSLQSFFFIHSKNKIFFFIHSQTKISFFFIHSKNKIFLYSPKKQDFFFLYSLQKYEFFLLYSFQKQDSLFLFLFPPKTRWLSSLFIQTHVSFPSWPLHLTRLPPSFLCNFFLPLVDEGT